GSAQAAEHVPEEDSEQGRADEPGLNQQRDVERVGPPVRLAGDELVVDREVVEAEPEERMHVEHLWDEVVDLEVRGRRTPAALQPRGDHGVEEVWPRVAPGGDERGDERQRYEHRP